MNSAQPAPPADVHPAALETRRLAAVCEIRFGRRRGPGGQHRNKVETAVVVTHQPTGVQAEATERRSQAKNRELAMFRLRVNLALQIRRAWNEHRAVNQSWRSRCVNRRISVNPGHEDFPALLAEALDVLADLGVDVPATAATLGVTSSQLVRFLKLEPRALAQVNRERTELGLRPLR